MASLVFSLLLLMLSSGYQGGRNSPSTADSLSAEFLARGLEAEKGGRHREALSIWVKAKTRLSSPDLAIGSNYIRLVTAEGMDRYYRAAWGMYAWGLTAGVVAPNREALSRELESLSPLVDSSRLERWRQMLSANDGDLLAELRRWWKSRDPTPSTPYNERLMEHWERVAHVRRTYAPDTSRTGPLLGSDERGAAYLQYGAPDRTYSGRLWSRSSDICQVLRTRLVTEGAFARCESRSVRQMVDYIQGLTGNPPYEIWVYDTQERHEDMRYNLVLLFAGTGGGSNYRQYRTVEEMLPTRAFQPSRRYSYQGITPGIVIQWLYYDQLAGIDPYFTNLFSRIDFRFMRRVDPAQQQYLSMQLRQENEHFARNYQDNAPNELSTHARNLPHIPLEVHQYRLLDENGRPVFATFLNSRPQPAFLEDFAANQDSMLPAAGDPFAYMGREDSLLQRAFRFYRLYHGMELREETGKRLGGDHLQAVLKVDGNDMDLPSETAFTVPYAEGETRQLFYAQLHNRHPASSPPRSTPFPDYLRGLGKVEIPQPEPLDSRSGQLQMGELILGYEMRDSTAAETFLPFEVAHEKEIPEGERLAVHFEVYNLSEGQGGLRDFTIDYEILPVNFLGWTRENRDDLSLTLYFEHDRSRFTENLEIEASNLDPGRYVLRLEATDRTSGGQISREVRFRVVEQEGGE